MSLIPPYQFRKRRPYGLGRYQESDRDFIENNSALALWYLENDKEIRKALKAFKPKDSRRTRAEK